MGIVAATARSGDRRIPTTRRSAARTRRMAI
jgi:hypothetical protein